MSLVGEEKNRSRLVLKLKSLVPLLFLFLLIGLFFRQVLFSTSLLIAGKDALVNYPIVRFFIDEVASGRGIPLWDPYVFAGLPDYQYVSSFVAYPVYLVIYFLPVVTAFNLMYIIPFFIAAASMYLYGQKQGFSPWGSLTAAIVFTFNGYFLVRLWAGHLEVINAFVYLPLLFLLLQRVLERKDLVSTFLLGMSIGVVNLFGTPQYPAMMFLALGGYLIYWLYPILRPQEYRSALKITLCLAGALVLGLGLAAIYILPSYESFLQNYRRGGNWTFAMATYNSLNPRDLLTLFFPDLFGHELTGDYWGSAFTENIFYVGVLASLLALYAAVARWGRDRSVTFLTLLGAAAIVLSLGRYTPVYGLVYQWLPPFNMVRSPPRFLIVAVFSLSLLAGAGCDLVLQDSRRHIWKRARALAIGYLALVAALLASPMIFAGARGWFVRLGQWVIGFFYLGRPTHLLSLEEYYTKLDSHLQEVSRFMGTVNLANPAVHVPLGLAVLAFGILYLGVRWHLAKGWLGVAVVAFVLLDLWAFGARFLAPLPVTEHYRQWGFIEFLQQDEGFFRVFPVEGPQVLFEENDGEVYKIGNIDGDNAYMLRRFVEYANAANQRPLVYREPKSDYSWQAYGSRLVDLLNVKYLLREKGEVVKDGKHRLVYQGEVDIYQNEDFFPRAFFVPRYEVISDGEEILQRLQAPDFDPREVVILEKTPPTGQGGGQSATGEVAITHYSPNRLELRVNAQGNGFLVLSEVYYPGWKAYVDGRETEIYRGDFLFRTIFVPGGDHKVELTFQPVTFYLGAKISIVSFLIFVGGLVFVLIRKRRLNKGQGSYTPLTFKRG
ncbi:MAG: YfhO family protein [Chloroflexi bacterium]|nr:YfhO family protein [Chloroflexota bacterium]